MQPSDSHTEITVHPARRSRITNSPLCRANGNTIQGRRTRDLYRAIMARLGDPADPVIQADALAVAELKTAAETARLALLDGSNTDPNQLVRLENLANRIEKRLGLLKSARRKETPEEFRARMLAAARPREAVQSEGTNTTADADKRATADAVAAEKAI